MAEVFSLIFAAAAAEFFIFSGKLVVVDAILWDERSETTLRTPFWILCLSLSVVFTAHLLFILDHLQSPIMISVPFFILSAVLMQGGGLARVLFGAARAWIGGIRGGLAISGVAATAEMAAITGSSAATTMAMGTLLVPLMEERGYKPSPAMAAA